MNASINMDYDEVHQSISCSICHNDTMSKQTPINLHNNIVHQEVFMQNKNILILILYERVK